MNLFHQSNSKTPTRKFGLTWYRNFTKIKKDQLESRRGERQHKLRKYWTKHEKIVTMYDHVNTTIVDAKLATHLDESE